MRFLSLLALAVACDATTNNLDLLVDKAFNLGLVSGKVCDKASVTNIATCFQPSLLKCPSNMSNLTSAGLNCLLAKSGNYYVSVMGLLNSMNTCLKPSNEQAMDFLTKLLDAFNPVIKPLYKQLCGNMTVWAKTDTAAVVANKTWGWVNKQATRAVIETYCTRLVSGGVCNSNEWTCAKNPGNQVINFTSYACYSKTPASGR